PLQPWITAIEKLQACHLDRALVVRNHCLREITIRVRAWGYAHRSFHLHHDSLQCAVELARCRGARHGEQRANDLRCARCERQRESYPGSKCHEVQCTATQPARLENAVQQRRGAHGRPPVLAQTSGRAQASRNMLTTCLDFMVSPSPLATIWPPPPDA